MGLEGWCWVCSVRNPFGRPRVLAQSPLGLACRRRSVSSTKVQGFHRRLAPGARPALSFDAAQKLRILGQGPTCASGGLADETTKLRCRDDLMGQETTCHQSRPATMRQDQNIERTGKAYGEGVQ